MNDLKIIIPTCDKYLHLVEGLVYTIDKYWKNHGEVIILGYKNPNYDLPNNTTFHSSGNDRGPRYWSNDLIKYFKDFDEEYFINLVDDTLIIREVDVDRIDELFSFMKESDITKIFLSGSLVESYRSHEYGKMGLLEIKQSSTYRTSVQPAIIKTSYWMKYLKPKQTPWEFELQNSKNDGLSILSVKINESAPIIYSHLYRAGPGLMREWYISKKTKLTMYDEDKTIIKKMLNIN